MSAILSVSGKSFDPNQALVASTIKDISDVWLIGGRYKSSGFQVIFSDSADIREQVDSIIQFILSNSHELKRIKGFSGIEEFDFRISYFWRENVAALTYTFPADLHVSLADVGATLTYCVYPSSPE